MILPDFFWELPLVQDGEIEHDQVAAAVPGFSL